MEKIRTKDTWKARGKRGMENFWGKKKPNKKFSLEAFVESIEICQENMIFFFN